MHWKLPLCTCPQKWQIQTTKFFWVFVNKTFETFRNDFRYHDSIWDTFAWWDICPFIRVSLKKIFSAKLCLDSLILILFKVDRKRNILNNFHFIFQITQLTALWLQNLIRKLFKELKLTEEVLLLFLWYKQEIDLSPCQCGILHPLKWMLLEFPLLTRRDVI